jgi:molybdopterin-guanine dinucleotide biosynthesis protein A
MGSDKAEQLVAGVRLAELIAKELLEVAHPVLVVGPHSILSLRTIIDPGIGPLVALVSGWERLVAEGRNAPVLVCACDLPFITSGLLQLLVRDLGDADAVFPVFDARDQVLVACYAPAALERAQRLIKGGERSMRALAAELTVRRIPERQWRTVAPEHALMDVDTPEQLEAARRIAESRSGV